MGTLFLDQPDGKIAYETRPGAPADLYPLHGRPALRVPLPDPPG